tara:strand:- start:4729 stop:5457 length:729 start_codon:yes stop_codon:yes gene_type:complete
MAKKTPIGFADTSEAKRLYGGGALMAPPGVDVSQDDQVLSDFMKSQPTAKQKKPERSTYWDFSEWEKRQPGYGKPKRREPTLKEIGIDVGGAAPGKGKTLFELAQEARKYEETNRSSDTFIGIGEDGKPLYQRGTSTGEPFPVGPSYYPPPNEDGYVDTAMDIYRESAKNYPKDASIDAQQGFAVAASTQDYNSQGYAIKRPEKSTVVQYDGRVGERREYEDGSAFFVSADGNIILRLEDKD